MWAPKTLSQPRHRPDDAAWFLVANTLPRKIGNSTWSACRRLRPGFEFTSKIITPLSRRRDLLEEAKESDAVNTAAALSYRSPKINRHTSVRR